MGIIRSSIAAFVWGYAACASAATLGMNGLRVPGPVSHRVVSDGAQVVQVPAMTQSLRRNSPDAGGAIRESDVESANMLWATRDEAEWGVSRVRSMPPVSINGAKHATMRRFFTALTPEVDIAMRPAMSAGDVSLSQVASFLGFDMTHSNHQATGLKWVADFGLTQPVTLLFPQFAIHNPSFNAVANHDPVFEPFRLSSPRDLITHWQPIVTFGVNYPFK